VPRSAAAAEVPLAPVTVPQHPVDDSGLRLLAASESQFVLEQSAGYGARVLAGNSSSIVVHPEIPVTGDDYTLTGDLLSWSETTYAAGNTEAEYRVYREDLRTGATSSHPSADQPVAITPDGWLGWASGTLTRHVIGATSTASTTLLTGIASDRGLTVQADAAGAVLSYTQAADPDHRAQVGLITFGQPGIDRLTSADPSEDYDFGSNVTALSPNSVVWETRPVAGDGTEYLHRRDRSGGAASTVALAAGAHVVQLAATDDQIAVAGAIGERQLTVLTGTAGRTVTLPAPIGSDLHAVGARFYLGSGASILAFGADDQAPSKAAPVPPMPRQVVEVNLSAGQLTYNDQSGSAEADEGTIWQLPVARSASGITTGAEKSFKPKVLAVSPEEEGPVLSFSAGRGVIQRPSGEFQLLDRNVVQHTLAGPEAARVQASGPFTLLDDQLFGADGRRVLSLAAEHPRGVDLFGPNVVYCTPAGAVRLRRLPIPALGFSLPGIGDVGSDCAGPVAIWGSTVAWARSDGTIAVRTLPATAVRVVGEAGSGSGAVSELRLSEGALSWQAATGESPGTWVLELGSASSVPVAVDGLSSVTVDDHLLAGITALGAIELRSLPFGSSTSYPPRLIGLFAPASFAPGGSGRGSTWTPQFDVTKPVQSVQLTITQVSRVIRVGQKAAAPRLVRVLHGTGANGSIRDLTWNGTDARGRRMPVGRYTWRLTATAADGEGALAGLDGHGTITGSITLKDRT
jgi:hypothetical protein